MSIDDDDDDHDPRETIALALSQPAFVILTAAGGFEPGCGLRPALVNIIASLTMIAIAIHDVVPPDEYAKYVALVTRNLDRARDIVASENPALAFDQLMQQLRLEHEPSSNTVN